MDEINQTAPVTEMDQSPKTDDLFAADQPAEEQKQSEFRPAGPGLPESLGWLMLFFGLQIAGMVVVFAVAILTTVDGLQSLQGFQLDAWLGSLGPTGQLIVLASPAFLCYLVLIPLGLLRMSPRPLAELNLSLPRFGQMLVAASMVLPLTMLADATMKFIEPHWLELAKQVPFLQGLNNTDVHKMLAQFGEASFPVALFLIAVVPAVGEEFLFRGLIGRGLIARWGLMAGVGITSCLFAVVHIYPPHVMAIIPVGVAMHWVYLTTKSFWAPMLFHFLNNGIATVLMRAEQAEGELHWTVLPLAVTYVVWSLYWLFQLRTTYRSESGEEHSQLAVVAATAKAENERQSPTRLTPTLIAAVVIALEIYVIWSAFLPA